MKHLDWDKYKPLIIEMYLVENLTARDISKYLSTTLGRPKLSKETVQIRLKDWGVARTISESQRVAFSAGRKDKVFRALKKSKHRTFCGICSG